MSIDDESLFDDFGNYIGPEAPAEPSLPQTQGHPIGEGGQGEEDGEGRDILDSPTAAEASEAAANERYRQQIVLHEEKKYYLTAQELYGPKVETLVQDEDTQPLSEPIIAPLKTKHFQIESSLEEAQPAYDLSYLASLLAAPERVRNVSVVGSLHTGKSSLIDVLLCASHRGITMPESGMACIMNSLDLERSREISLHSKPVTLLLPTGEGAHMVLNLLDTPGHADFADEQIAALRLSDGVILVVDVLEGGISAQSEATIRRCLLAGLPMILVLNKMERLFLELKLPPADAYLKIRHVIQEMNTFIRGVVGDTGKDAPWFSPESGNVLFASTMSGWIFSLHSFATLYLQRQGLNGQPADEASARSSPHGPSASSINSLACRLWGEVYYERETGKFWRRPREGGRASKRTFVAFVLEPLYKFYGAILTEERATLQNTLRTTLGVSLRLSECSLNTRTVLRKAFAAWFGRSSVRSLVTAIRQQLPDPREASFGHLLRYGTSAPGPAAAIRSCDAHGPLVAFTCKAYPMGEGTRLAVLARIFSGTLCVGQKVRLVEMEGIAGGGLASVSGATGGGSGNAADSAMATIGGLALAGPRYRVPITSAPAGSLVLVTLFDTDGRDHVAFQKAATILPASRAMEEAGDTFVFAPLALEDALMKVAIEPAIPGDLPKMLQGIKFLLRTYPQLDLRIEDSGEHALMGPGELYLDCALHDLRHLYTDSLEVRVADPVARLAETVAEGSYLKCHARTPNGQNRLAFIAEPLERSVIAALEQGRLPDPRAGPESCRELARLLQTEHGWDKLAARSVWAFSDDARRYPSVLLNDTLPGETDGMSLEAIKELVIQGFHWACREGPLVEEPVRGVRFRLVEAQLASADPVNCPPGQVIPTVRRACHAALLTASPRLMEPVLRVQVQTIGDFVEAVYGVLAQRRGHVTQDTPRAGTPLYLLNALVPLMDSFGLETDLRIHAQGMASIQCAHDTWQMVSGDPLDSSIKLLPLEPAGAPHLARDYLVKTRRRKGLGEEVRVAKFFDEEMLADLAKEEALSGIRGLQI